MLSSAEAQEQLRVLRVADWRGRRSAAVKSLPRDLRSAAWGILGCDAQGAAVKEAADLQRLLRAAADRLDDIGAEQRARVFTILFGSLAPHVEAAWRLLTTAPYQDSYIRHAFRAPASPVTTRPKRASWLRALTAAVEGYDQDMTWFAAWAPHLGWGAPETLGVLFAAAIDGGGATGQSVYETLIASAAGEHPIGAMGRHVTRGLLLATRPDGWDFIEKLLLAAQRQEGLRQVILETMDEAHPQAFRRLLRLILDHDLCRFSAVARAADVWLGAGWEATDTRAIREVLGRVLRFLDDPTARAAALAGTATSASDLYLALWAVAYEDALAALAEALDFLSAEDAGRRFAAAHLLAQLGLVGAQKALVRALDDPDLRVACRALSGLSDARESSFAESDLFERLERLVPRLPRRPMVQPPILWEWLKVTADRAAAHRTLLDALHDRPADRLLPHLANMDASTRYRAADRLAGVSQPSAAVRDALFELLGDASSTIRERAVQALNEQKIGADEAQRLEALLTRSPDDLRRGVLGLLIGQSDRAALASAERLLAATDPLQRQAGLDLVRALVDAGRAARDCRAIADRYRAAQLHLSDAEQRTLDALAGSTAPAPTLEDGLGLFDPRQRTAPRPPRMRRHLLGGLDHRPFASAASAACLSDLDNLVHQHRTEPITMRDYPSGTREELLGNIRYGFPSPAIGTSAAEDAARLPLRAAWEGWWSGRPPALRDMDGCELLRARAAFEAARYTPVTEPAWLVDALAKLFGPADVTQLRYPSVVRELLEWLIVLHPPAASADFLLDAVEATLAYWGQAPGGPALDHRTDPWLWGWLRLARRCRDLQPATWQPGHHVRLWQLLRWLDEPMEHAPRRRPNLTEVAAAYGAGAATEADLLDQLLGPRGENPFSHGRYLFWDLHQLTRRQSSSLLAAYPYLRPLSERCRDRILAVEIARGELPTAATAAALALATSGGSAVLVQILSALGPAKFARGWTSQGLGRAAVLSHLARSAYPSADDTAERFAARIRSAQIPDRRLIELAVYAPQWARHVEETVGWPGLAEAAWWLLAHTRDQDWHVEQEVREEWVAQVAEATPLTGQDLLDGAVDVAWFRRVYAALGAQRWAELYAAAIYASGGGGHTRAQLYAGALLGQVSAGDLLKRARDKRYQDALRALGLAPLAEGPGRAADLLHRYEAIQEFLRTSKQFGSQRQASEKLAAAIALQNLARTAGYPDPVRLEWAMERQAVADLAAGPLVVESGAVAVTLSINGWGEPELTAHKNGRRLSAVPATAKKDPAITALGRRKGDLTRQAGRMRRSLEEAMCRGDLFTGVELAEMLAHPLLAPMLSELVFCGDALAGYPAEFGRTLRSYDGRLIPLPPAAPLRIAHPHDLLLTGAWSDWQRDCYLGERVQPFKQVFRELYVLTAAERAAETISRRYDGHQVNPRQALALLGGRGWVNHPDEGVRRTFHSENLTAHLHVMGATWTPADVEGLTLTGVTFTQRGEALPLPLAGIPPRIFSETLRDLDLVVSVAHMGGVDPEASASTLEMRASLIRETSALLNLSNVRLQGSHALIEGQLSSYNVHLGSGVVHRQPGGALCIVPVHGQHSGRLFLPFADDDPKTAELLAKVLLLAKDTEIKDPTILEQILGPR